MGARYVGMLTSSFLAFSQSPVSPAWDTIDALYHVRLLLCQSWHNVTCTEVLPCQWGSSWSCDGSGRAL